MTMFQVAGQVGSRNKCPNRGPKYSRDNNHRSGLVTRNGMLIAILQKLTPRMTLMRIMKVIMMVVMMTQMGT